MITTTLHFDLAPLVRPRIEPSAPGAEEAAPNENLLRLRRPSKTRRKQDSHELQSLGAALLELSDERLAGLGLAEPLLDAIRAQRRIRSHEARRRQLQLIGKLMRSADVEPLRQAVDELELGRAQDSLALHEAERWRAELIADDAAATRFASAHPGADTQRLRALVRSARKDASLVPERRSGRAFRELFQFVREQERSDG
ncbi:MAG: ribosome biogenesis factor YjgA [Caldimonas sp.]